MLDKLTREWIENAQPGPEPTRAEAAARGETYEPRGTRFIDLASGREMLLVAEGQPFAGWLAYRHADGQWVTMRKATADDLERITKETALLSTLPEEDK